jgi:cobalt-zinc-cadmium efflux system outer membrane protein
MVHRSAQWLSVSLMLLTLAGCLYPVGDKIDAMVCDLAARPYDLAPGEPVMPPAANGKGKTNAAVKQAAYFQNLELDESFEAKTATAQKPFPPETDKAGKDTGKPLDKKGAELLMQRLGAPFGIPGGEAPRTIPLLPLKPENKAENERRLAKVYFPLEPLGPDPMPQLGPQGRPLTLADLQRLALSNSPLIKQAAANVEAARGAALQAGLHPNPIFGYNEATAGTTGGPGYQGVYLEQLIKTANKLQLARSAATMDWLNAQLALRRAQTDLSAQVRGGYFGVLVAKENVRISRAMADFTQRIYEVYADQLRTGGLAAPYEPLLLRVLADQSRLSLIQARNSYVAAWKQLAANLGLPGMPLTELAGRIDMTVPVFDHEKVLAYVLSRHTDVRIAENTLQKAKFNLRFAQVTPIPDVDVQFLLQKDFTGPPFNVVHSLQATIPIPVWDRNQGNIIQAQGNLINAAEQAHVVRDSLTGTVSDAFNRYLTGRTTVRTYRDRILPDQVTAYSLLVRRYAFGGETTTGGPPPTVPPAVPPPVVPTSPPPAFIDTFNAQQNLQTYVTNYVTALGQMWQAVVDVANVLQTDDLFQLGIEPLPTECLLPIPDLTQLPPLPCCHPCSPLLDPRLKGADGTWKAVEPGKEHPVMPPAKNGNGAGAGLRGAGAGLPTVPPRGPKPSAKEMPAEKIPVMPKLLKEEPVLELPKDLPPLEAKEPPAAKSIKAVETPPDATPLKELPATLPPLGAPKRAIIATGTPGGIDSQLLEPPPVAPRPVVPNGPVP